MNTPLFSIIIPIYKVRQDYLEICIESIRNQSFQNIEIIMVDDGSPDNCGVLCDDYAKKDSRIRVIHQINQGVSVARNAGIEAAKGEWIMFVDADDWVEEGCYDKIANYVVGCDYDILMFRHFNVYENKQIVINCDLRSDIVYDTNNISDKESLYRIGMRPPKVGFGGVYFSWDKVFRRNFLVEKTLRYPIGLPKSEDKVFILHCFEKLRKLRFINGVFYYYRINVDSVCNRYSEQADRDRVRLAQILMPMALRMDEEIGTLKQQEGYVVLSNDCKRFLFGIISDVLSLKFFHPDCPYEVKERIHQANLFIRTEPFNRCIREIKYNELSLPAKLKKFLLEYGAVKTYYNVYNLFRLLQNKKVKNC